MKSYMAWPSFSTQRPLLYKKCVYSNRVNAWKKESEKKSIKTHHQYAEKMFLYVCCNKDILACLKIILDGKISKFFSMHLILMLKTYSQANLFELIRQNIAGWWCQKNFCFQKFVDNTQQYFAFTYQENCPSHFNFHWWWCQQIQATF